MLSRHGKTLPCRQAGDDDQDNADRPTDDGGGARTGDEHVATATGGECQASVNAELRCGA